MKHTILFILLLVVSNTSLFARDADSTKVVAQPKYYSFIFQDSPARLFMMRQFNEDYLSGFRLLSKSLDNSLSPVVNYSIQTVLYFTVLGALTHEEGHRSILSAKSIGSISQPYYFSRRAGYIAGITDHTLANLRDSDFPDFMRLYTAGSESDYMLGNREETMMAFGDESFRNLAVEYIMRKAFLIQYYLLGFIHYNVDGPEESNELKRDVVGNDIYGAARHLYRPIMPFHRYTLWNDLSAEEKDYVYKLGYRSLLNLINLNMIGIPSISISKNLKVNAGMGHVICPFGDLIDENFWISYKKYKIQAYVREYQNRVNWFMAGGMSLKYYPINQRITATVSAHYWEQPLHLDFNEKQGKMGGALDVTGKYFFNRPGSKSLKRISVDLGLIYKTEGFLPEEVYMSKHFGFRLGTTFNIL